MAFDKETRNLPAKIVAASRRHRSRRFYETEALRGGWSVRQLDRQINSQFYERTALSRNKAAMLNKGQKALPEDRVLPEEEIKDPYALAGLPNKVMATEYKTVLPDEKLLAAELERTRRLLNQRKANLASCFQLEVVVR